MLALVDKYQSESNVFSKYDEIIMLLFAKYMFC